MKKPKIVVIVGPTASGKSALAVRLAKKYNGEIISADSRQVYRGLDIGTAKITKREMRGIPHRLIDVAHPKRAYTVVDFKQDAAHAIREIASRGTLPILVGGTAFWIDALVHGLIFPNVRSNPSLRRRLGKKSASELFTILKTLDPERAAAIDPKNPRRLIRAIEIARTLGRIPPLKKRSPYHTLWIGLNPSPSPLKRRIATRAARMIKNGLIRETQTLLKKKISKKRIREFGFEYRAALDCIEKKITRAELRARLTRDTFAYAKRQIRWFKKNKKIRWVKNHARSLPLLISKTIAGYVPTTREKSRPPRKSVPAAPRPQSRPHA